MSTYPADISRRCVQGFRPRVRLRRTSGHPPPAAWLPFHRYRKCKRLYLLSLPFLLRDTFLREPTHSDKAVLRVRRATQCIQCHSDSIPINYKLRFSWFCRVLYFAEHWEAQYFSGIQVNGWKAFPTQDWKATHVGPHLTSKSRFNS